MLKIIRIFEMEVNMIMLTIVKKEKGKKSEECESFDVFVDKNFGFEEFGKFLGNKFSLGWSKEKV